ncbi:MAG: hypothetical protein NTX52_11850 [Planctomycetota bacterium]|nr:hypothetical protein [Planctomycetota bacterium]
MATEKVKNPYEMYKRMGGANAKELCENEYRKSIGEKFIVNKVKDGIICYKPEYAFLKDAWWWNACKVREDFLVSPHAALCKCCDYGEPYVEREYSQDGIKIGQFKKLCQLHEKEYDKIKFEEVMGVKLHEDTDVGYLYHTYSGGIEFLGVSKFPKKLKDELKKVIIEGMSELSIYGIDYHDPLPSNLRYNFDGRLICNPHNCIECFDRPLTTEEQIENLLALLYTNTWIENAGEFLSEYFGNRLPEEEVKWIKKRIEEKMKNMDESGDNIEVPFHWWPRWGR